MIPVNSYFNARYVVLGNEHDLNNYVVDKEGNRAYLSFDQTEESTNKHNSMIQEATGGSMGVMSVIRPLTNIAEFKILFNRYPEYTKYMTSCNSLDISKNRRWCNKCSTCLGRYLVIKAVGGDVKKVGFREDLLKKKFRYGFNIFGKDVDIYEKTDYARDEMLLAFYLAYKNKVKGELIDMFKKKYLSEVVVREDELMKKCFKIHQTRNMPDNISKKVLSIYKEELA
jgi:hypothetical protein